MWRVGRIQGVGGSDDGQWDKGPAEMKSTPCGAGQTRAKLEQQRSDLLELVTACTDSRTLLLFRLR